MAFSRYRLRMIGVALALGLLYGLAWIGASRLVGRSNGLSPEASLLVADPACDPAVTTCTAHGQALNIELRLGGGARSLEPFSVEVFLHGPAASGIASVSSRFTMVGMDMGINRFVLDPREGGVWQGQAWLPICSTGRQDWKITVEATGSRRYEGEFSVVFER